MIVCVVNQKGGVGKTTTSVNLSAALADLNRRVLIVDMDPQGNASSGLGLKRQDYQRANVYHILIGEEPDREWIYPTALKNLFVLPANTDLVGAEIELVNEPKREQRLKQALGKIHSHFDFIFIDCPPSLGLLTLNALNAAQSFLVPLQCEYYALEGLSHLLHTVGLVKKTLNPDLKMEGIVLTMFDGRNNLSHQVAEEIRSHFNDKVFQTLIPRNVRLSEAPSHGQPIFVYDPQSSGALKYMELAKEVLNRHRFLAKTNSKEIYARL